MILIYWLRPGDVVPTGDCDTTIKRIIYDICFMKFYGMLGFSEKPITY